jgi:hypothetical protein
VGIAKSSEEWARARVLPGHAADLLPSARSLTSLRSRPHPEPMPSRKAISLPANSSANPRSGIFAPEPLSPAP